MTGPLLTPPPALFEQSYEHLLLVHWPVPEGALRALLPAGVDPVPFEGTHWVGHDVYLGTHLQAFGLAAPTGLDVRPMITLRTIVDVRGVRGLFLLSLDAPNALAAWAERQFLSLRSHTAEVEIAADPGGGLWVDARRVADGAALRARYRPLGEAAAPREGTREAYLLGGDRLYAGDSERLLAVDVVHGPWALAPATVTFEVDTIASSAGLPPPPPDLVAVYQRLQTARIATAPRPI